MLALCYIDLKQVCPEDFLHPYLQSYTMKGGGGLEISSTGKYRSQKLQQTGHNIFKQ